MCYLVGVGVVLFAVMIQLATGAASPGDPQPEADETAALTALAAEEPDPRLADALRAFDALQLETAARLFEGVAANPAVDTATRARAWLLLGQTRAGLVDDVGAGAAFAAALAIDPSLALPAGTSPKVRSLFQRTREALLQTHTPSSLTAAPTATATATATTAKTTAAKTAPKATLVDASAGMSWSTGLSLLGGALLVGGAVAAVGAAVADNALAEPTAGRLRAEHDQIRTLGLTSLAGSIVFGAAGVTTLVVGVASSFVEDP